MSSADLMPMFINLLKSRLYLYFTARASQDYSGNKVKKSNMMFNSSLGKECEYEF